MTGFGFGGSICNQCHSRRVLMSCLRSSQNLPRPNPTVRLVGFGRIWSDLDGFGWILGQILGRIWGRTVGWSDLFGVGSGRGPSLLAADLTAQRWGSMDDSFHTQFPSHGMVGPLALPYLHDQYPSLSPGMW